MPVISVITPVYNVGSYLEQCVNSVRSQSFQDWELILIDDGSTDHSAALCDRFAQEDARIRVQHQMNSGVAICRNKGIQLAKGEWICYVDSDDWLEPDYLQTLYENALALKADVCICGRMEEHTNTQRPLPICKEVTIMSSAEAVKAVYQRDLQSCLWATILRKSILQEPVPSLSRYEDHAVFYKWLSHANRIALLPAMPYHFRVRKSSLMHRTGNDDEHELMPIVNEMYLYILERQLLSDSENRSIAAQNYIRIAKDVARSQDTDKAMALQRIRAAIAPLLPVDSSITGSKPYRRIRLLMFSPALFIRVLTFSQFFVRQHKPSSRIPFE